MIATFFTKPLQGSKFTRIRDQILNVQSEPDITAISTQRSVLGNDAQADLAQRGRQGVQPHERRPVDPDTPGRWPRCTTT